MIFGRTAFISFATFGEILFGLYRSEWTMKKKMDYQSALKAYHVIHSSSEICETWGWINTERKTQPFGMNDAWIAATALTYDVPLVTHNIRDFAGINGLQILTAS